MPLIYCPNYKMYLKLLSEVNFEFHHSMEFRNWNQRNSRAEADKPKPSLGNTNPNRAGSWEPGTTRTLPHTP